MVIKPYLRQNNLNKPLFVSGYRTSLLLPHIKFKIILLHNQIFDDIQTSQFSLFVLWIN
jgi:hypothetical protein